MSLNAELAAAARWIASKVGTSGLTDSEAARAWNELTMRLEDCRSEGSKELAIIEWRAEMAERLAVRLAHSPLPATKLAEAP